jgi:multidrug efflux system membrane fusion protein
MNRWLLLALVAGLTLPVACKKDAAAPGGAVGAGSARGAGAGGGKRGLQQASFPVEVLQIGEKPHELLVTAPGLVDAFEVIQVTARVAGVVDKVNFTEGQEVKVGQPLALVDSRRYALSVSSANAALEKAQATAADSEASLKRRENAVSANPGLIPGEELETFKTKLRTAQADVSGAREALKLSHLNLDDSTVKAAADGIIQTRTVQTGQYVNAGAVIATLLRRDPMLLRFSVTTAEAPRLKVGMPVDFTLKESQATYQAKITLVSGAADPESRLVPVTAEISSDHKFWLRPGSFASVAIKLTSQRVFPMIPQNAARPSDKGFLAYVIERAGENEVAHERVLELGLHTTDGFVEVKSGLKAGERVVTKGVEALAEGTKVRIATVPSGQPGAPSGAAPSGSASASAEGDKGANEAAPPGSSRPRRQRGERTVTAAPGAPVPQRQSAPGVPQNAPGSAPAP